MKTVSAFILLGFAQIAIFFNTPRHFFMGDTLMWLGYRYDSFAEFLDGFTRVDQGAWYRPLAQKTLGSLLFPFAGLNPIPYRIAGFVLFFACTVAVFLFARYVSESPRIAWLATVFFTPHVTHVFVTYDVAFTPELLFTLFFIGSAAAYAAYLRNGNRRLLAASATLFAGGLLSKETAVALPGALVLIWLLLPRKERGKPLSLAPHVAVLGLYLVLAIGHLHIRDVSPGQLLERPGRAGQPGYELVLGKNVSENFDVALGWAFGIPRSTYTEDMITERWMLAALKVIRTVICVGALIVLFTSRRNLLLLGVGWFVTALLPTLPLLDHFLPYYLFAPLVGFALGVGTVLDWLYTQSSRIVPGLGLAVCVVLLTLSAAIHAGAANKLAFTHSILGGSARNAENSLRDLQSRYPTIPPNTMIVLFNEEYPAVTWDQAGGMLFQMAYDDPSLVMRDTADGIPVAQAGYDRDRVLAFKWMNSHLVDMTSMVKQWPDLLLPHAPGENLYVEATDSATRIPGLPNQTVAILVARDGAVQAPRSIRLDDHGDGPPISDGEAPGTYTLIAVRREGATGWLTVSKSITIR